MGSSFYNSLNILKKPLEFYSGPWVEAYKFYNRKMFLLKMIK